MTPGAVSSDDVTAARKLIRDVISDTPVLHSRVLSETVGGPVFLKCENLQRPGRSRSAERSPGSPRLVRAERARGVVAASAGNHAQGVALAAADPRAVRGASTCRTVRRCPRCRPPSATARRSSCTGRAWTTRLVAARAFADAEGACSDPPLRPPRHRGRPGHRRLEIIEQCPEVRTVLVCTGGGGLLAGVATAASRGCARRRRVVGVQAEGGGRLSGVAGRRASGDARGDVDHGGRDRGGPPG